MILIKDLTEIVCIIDRSGSMQSTRDDAIGGFNSFITSQKAAPGRAQMTLTLFNTEVEIRYDGKDIQEIPELNPRTYVPGGMTALLDAVGTTLTRTRERIEATPEPERPAKVMVVVITDGMENSSREYRRADLEATVKALQDQGWQFLYLGADMSAFDDASSIGLAKHQYVSHGNSHAMAYRLAHDVVMQVRSQTLGKSDQDDDTDDDPGCTGPKDVQ